MVDPGGGKQQGFAHRAEIARLAGQNQTAQFLGERRAARLARDHDLPHMVAQPRGETTDLGRLAGAFAAFESDEPTVAQGRLLPEIMVRRP